MGLFSRKKPKVDLDAVFKEKYKDLNQIVMQAQQEHDYIVKESLLKLVCERYDELLKLIDEGAHFDEIHFMNLQQHAREEYDIVHDINVGE